MKTSVLCSSLVALMASNVQGFAPTTISTGSTSTSSTTQISANTNAEEGDSRREFFSKSLATYTAAALASTGVLAPLPANAAAADKVNTKLKAYGLPPLAKVPNGMKPLLEVYGKGKNRFPLLVQMCHPFTWVVQLPSNDVNGEDGTIQAGEYAKGDTATFFLYQDEGHVDNIGKADKSLFERALIKSISQKGANMYQNFKVIKAVPQTDNPAYNGKDYVLCDFKYELLTGAGFEVQRRGVAAITSEGPAVEVLWAASTTLRWGKTEETLREIVGTFRVYSDGLNFSDEIAKNEERFAMQYD